MNIVVGILGLSFRSGNKGCEALTYSFFHILNDIAFNLGQKIEVRFIESGSKKQIIKTNILNLFSLVPKRFRHFQALFLNLSFNCARYELKNGHYLFSEGILKCNYVFDFTAGDSFTDIYGEERFYERSNLKRAIIDNGIKLVLGSQTYGPFNNADIEKMASDIIKDSYEVFARDEQSQQYAYKISNRIPKLTTDIAFCLPFSSQAKSDRVQRIGFNPSGLLWNGGYNRSNQFGLTVDYQTYCKEVISSLVERGFEVHLIAHAFTVGRVDLEDNDWVAICALKQLFPSVIVAPYYDTPMEIKSYISGMNVFIGARMHATIAALSSCTPVIPFSYSRKFEGLFSSLSYDYVIHGLSDTTKDAVNKTLLWIESVDKLETSVDNSASVITRLKENVITQYETIIKNKL